MRVMLFFAILLSLHADESFITKEEYAKQLFHNPRGIGCHLCHGEAGEGKAIADFEDKKGQHTFTAPPINTIDFETFSQALSVHRRGMPRYFLTDMEHKALYYYLHPKSSTR